MCDIYNVCFLAEVHGEVTACGKEERELEGRALAGQMLGKINELETKG